MENLLARLLFAQWFPGLIQLKNYQKEWLVNDFRAAFSVVAVALPVAIAYAQLTGVSAIVGLYSCVLPMLVYALMGTSRQLIVGPDAQPVPSSPPSLPQLPLATQPNTGSSS